MSKCSYVEHSSLTACNIKDWWYQPLNACINKSLYKTLNNWASVHIYRQHSSLTAKWHQFVLLQWPFYGSGIEVYVTCYVRE